MASAPGDKKPEKSSAPGDKKPEKSYLSSAVDSINPWAASRTSTPVLPEAKRDDEPVLGPASASGDHSTTPLYGQSFRTYPKDCPPLKVQWFHAIDVPKRKPHILHEGPAKQQDAKDQKPVPLPKKFTAFSSSDSRRLEAGYQKLLEAVEDGLEGPDALSRSANSAPGEKSGTRVPVNEDFLFDVDIEQRELSPVYWLGAIYQVRRGTWFFQEGSNLKPCEENLAAQLEEGYLKMKPWLYQARSAQAIPKDTGSDVAAGSAQDAKPEPTTPKPAEGPTPPAAASTTAQPQLSTYRLFGSYMNNVATYQDGTTAWLSSESMLSWVTSSVYERFAGGGYMSGVKLVRGYVEPTKAKEKEKEKDTGASDESQDVLGLDQRQQRILKRRSAPPTTGEANETETVQVETQQSSLERQLSSLLSREGANPAEAEEEIRRREEQEIQDDYNAQAGEAQGREIEHLVLVTHGIGQRLGVRMESINFVHDVNVLRKTLKGVYTNSADLKSLNTELGAGPGNCRVQVLPVCWRHLIDFPRRRQKKGEHDLGEVAEDEDEYPSLEDITVEGVAFARSLISDLALDVLLYQSSYRQEISRVVVGETNRILALFKERNPDFAGKIHVMGHSLGSAIFFDVLCRQRERRTSSARNPLRIWPAARERAKDHDDMQFDFEVYDFYCLGSPVGLFQMLKGRTIAARHTPTLPPPSPPRPSLRPEDINSIFHPPNTHPICPTTGLPTNMSSPKVHQLFNIFHPSDPVSYRLEPLISPAMASLKPQALPYTKRSIFSVAPQGLTGIGARVGQSVSGLWSSLSAGIASNLLNRSLGISSDDAARLAAGQADGAAEADERKKRLAATEADETLIDDDLETLYSTFQRGRAVMREDAPDEGAKARKMRIEETKVRALNRNGRVDYNIQESALDFNPINTIASHMGYWADEDVSHFVLSQLLSNRSRPNKRKY